MKVLVNSIPQNIDISVSIKNFLHALAIQTEGTAIAINGSIIPQSEFETKFLNENDEIEIIRAVGGG